jgi:molybdenum cofactor synthesis domain-containing protein
MPNSTVSGIIIGNEVLTAKVTEANGALLMRRFRERGISLHSVHFIRDDIDDIVAQVSACRRRADYVVTSGGVGPTHDDVTVRAVSLALHRPVVRLAEMEAKIRRHFEGRALPAEALRMAEAPQGATLIPSDDARFPVLECQGIFILPGVPQLFRVHLETVMRRLPGKAVSLRQLYLRAFETDIAAGLDAVASSRPHVAFGSYPTWDDGVDYRVRLTVEHEAAGETAAAVMALKATLGEAIIVREEHAVIGTSAPDVSEGGKSPH